VRAQAEADREAVPDQRAVRTQAAGEATREDALHAHALAETGDPALEAPEAQSQDGSAESGSGSLVTRVGTLIHMIQANDDAGIEEAIVRLSRRHRLLSPLAFAVGALVLLFDGLRLLVTNWRLLLVQILPAMWIWFAMADLKAHVLHGKSFYVLQGPILIPICIAIVAITMGSFFLNAVFAFSISGPRPPRVRPAVAQARGHLLPILVSGGVVGLMLALATTVATRYGPPWFALSLGFVVGVMMVSYVAVPARVVGIKPSMSKRDKLTATAVGGAIGATICTPPYALGRIGILMLGSKPLLIPGIILLAIGATLQAGATGAVRAIKMSTKLAVRGEPGVGPAEASEPA
jgi:hypothetical protein